MFSDDYNVANPRLAPNSSSDVKAIEITPYPELNGTGPLYLYLVYWMFPHLKFVEDSFITHNFKTQLSEFDTIKYDSNIAFHCEAWSFSQSVFVVAKLEGWNYCKALIRPAPLR